MAPMEKRSRPGRAKGHMRRVGGGLLRAVVILLVLAAAGPVSSALAEPSVTIRVPSKVHRNADHRRHRRVGLRRRQSRRLGRGLSPRWRRSRIGVRAGRTVQPRMGIQATNALRWRIRSSSYSRQRIRRNRRSKSRVHGRSDAAGGHDLRALAKSRTEANARRKRGDGRKGIGDDHGQTDITGKRSKESQQAEAQVSGGRWSYTITVPGPRRRDIFGRSERDSPKAARR